MRRSDVRIKGSWGRARNWGRDRHRLQTTGVILIIAVSVLTLALVWSRAFTDASSSASQSSQASQPSQGWQERRAVHISNPNTTELRDYQTRIELEKTTFDFGHAQAGGADLRFTDQDGTRQLSYYIERYDAAAQRAVVWVKVPVLPPSSTTTIYAYSAHATAETLSSARRTFEMADDFGQPGLGYYAFGPPTTVLTQTQAWETQSPHTLSVVELNREGYRYWGYYGLADCGGMGLARSNDLVHWQKADAPLLAKDGERWPSAQTLDGTVYLIYDRNYCGISHIVLRTSADGKTFSDPYRVIVRQEQGVRNQNPALFRDPVAHDFYLYWFRGGAESGFWQIKMRSAKTVEGLADETSERILIDVPYELAAPNMLYAAGTYFLSTEVNENAWKTKIYAALAPSGPFTALPDAPQLSDNQACLFQHVFTATVMHGYICKIIGTGWVLQHRTADISAGRPAERSIDPGVWQALVGDWITAPERGVSGNITVRGSVTGTDTGLLQTALMGADYVFGARGRSAGGTWGIAVRMQDPQRYTRVVIRPEGTLLIERLIDGKPSVQANVPLNGFEARSWHLLEARIVANTTEAWVDGQRVAQGLADQPPDVRGHSALVVQGQAEFDDVRWRKFATQEPITRISPAEEHLGNTDDAHWLSVLRPQPVYAPVIPPAPASTPVLAPGPTSAPDSIHAQSPILAWLAALFTLIGAGIVVVGFARSRGGRA